MEKLNNQCICCYQPFQQPCKYTYCYTCNKLPITENKCVSTTKNTTQCKLKALKSNESKCFYHQSKSQPIFID